MSELDGMSSEELPAPKSAGEYRIERLTWFGLVGVLVVAGVLPDWLTLHNALTPGAAGLVLMFSGVYQYRHKWRVSFSTWVSGTLLLVLAGFSFISRPDLDLSIAVISVAVLVIALGVFTNET